MTSEIRANTLKNRVGLGTVSYTNTGIIVSGIVTANSFSGPISGTTGTFSGINVVTTGTNVGVAVTQNGTGNILNLYDGSNLRFAVDQYGNPTVTSGNPVYASTNSSSNVTTTLFSNSAGQGVLQTNSGHSLILGTGAVEKVRITGNGHVNIGGDYAQTTYKLKVTGTSYFDGNLTATGDIDVDGHTNLDNVSIAGVTTFSNATTIVNGGYHRGIINSGAQAKIIGGYISGSDTLRLGESMYLTTTGLGIGVASPGRKFHIKDNGQIKLENTSTGSWAGLEFLCSSGTNDYDAYMGVQDSDGLFFIDNNSNGIDFAITRGGNIGINETAPSEKLQIDGDILLGGQANSSESNYAIKFEYNQHQFAKIVGDGRDSSGYGDIDFYTSTGSGVSNLTQRMSIRADGKIGIGDFTSVVPDSLLHINGLSGSAQVRLQRINAAANTNDYGRIYFESTSNVLTGEISVARESGEDNGYMHFKTASGGTLTERLRISSTGQLLHTANKSSGYTARFVQAHADNPATIEIDSPSNNHLRPSAIQFMAGGTNKWGIGEVYNPSTQNSFHICAGTPSQSNSKVVVTADGHVLFSGLSTKNDTRNAKGITIKSSSAGGGISFQNFGSNGSKNWRIRPDDLTGWGTLEFSVSPTTNSTTDWPDHADDVVLCLKPEKNVNIPNGRLAVGLSGTPSATFEVVDSTGGDYGHTKQGWATKRTFSVPIINNETRYYKLVNYQAGNMLVGRLEIYTSRGGGFNQTKGYNEWRVSWGGYTSSGTGTIYGTAAENTSFYAGTAASVDLVKGDDGGTDENIYIKVPGSIYSGRVYFIFEGIYANWQWDESTYQTSAP